MRPACSLSRALYLTLSNIAAFRQESQQSERPKLTSRVWYGFYPPLAASLSFFSYNMQNRALFCWRALGSLARDRSCESLQNLWQ